MRIQPDTVIGIDTGGTFTDFVLVDGGQVRTWKLPSTPDDPSRAVLEGLSHLLGERAATVFHGSTVATNALLEGKGAKVALVVTMGFGDLLLIGRQNRPHLYGLHPRRQARLVPHGCAIEVLERVGAGGEIEVPLTEGEIQRVTLAVEETGADSIAICLLHSYAHPYHERHLAEAIAAKGFPVSPSSQILREYREFERAVTTVVNAAVSPVMTRYLDRLKEGLGGRPLRVMQSNGGSISASAAGAEAARTILSGPAGGMSGAFAMARKAGFERLITFDMGGTSTDVGLCPGEIPFTSETSIAGWPIKLPMMDIHTVGAGGGSTARLDAGGALRVGPESAGSDPGPACYGRGFEATVTDANLFLGRILPEYFLGGRMALDLERAGRVLGNLAKDAGLSTLQLAEGIIEVAEGTMSSALRVVSVERGHDPGDFVLLPFGGAGGLHACSIAEALGIERILIPPHPGLLSAMGLVLCDVVRDYSQSVLWGAEGHLSDGETILSSLRRRAVSEMEEEGFEEGELLFYPSADLRYQGQSFELNVPYALDMKEAFHACHERLYGYRDDLRPLEIVTLRLRVVGPGARPDMAMIPKKGTDLPVMKKVSIFMEGKEVVSPVYHRGDVPAGLRFTGPALVVEDTATHLIRPEWTGVVDLQGNLILERR